MVTIEEAKSILEYAEKKRIELEEEAKNQGMTFDEFIESRINLIEVD